jgi:hypothetical protein
LRQRFDCSCFACESAILPERLFSDPSDCLGPEHGNAWSQAMQAYFLEQTDEAATKDVLQKLWMDGAMKLCSAKDPALFPSISRFSFCCRPSYCSSLFFIPAFSAVYHSFSPEFKRVKPPTSHVVSAWLERSSYGNPKSGGSRFITV